MWTSEPSHPGVVVSLRFYWVPRMIALGAVKIVWIEFVLTVRLEKARQVAIVLEKFP